MSRTLRIAAVTGGLLVAGAIAGAIAADASILLVSLFDQHGASITNGESLLFTGVLGALLGAVLLPITAWIFLRPVPLGLAVLGTLLGTMVGGAAGWGFFSSHDPFPAGFSSVYAGHVQGGATGAFAGFALSALLLRLLASVPRVPVSVRG